MNKLTILIVSIMFAFNAQAEGLDAKQIFFGGGLSLNDYGFGDDATGFQIFAGLPIPVKMGDARLSAEVGFMDAGDVDQNVTVPGFGVVSTASASANGLWANAVIEVPVGQTINLVGRAGLDFGDDDGIMIGGGVGIPVNKNIDIRFEYVIRDHIDSLQANIVIRQ